MGEATLNSYIESTFPERTVKLLHSGTCNIKKLIEILNKIEICSSKVVISNGLINKEISLVGKGGGGKFCLLQNCESSLKLVK